MDVNEDSEDPDDEDDMLVVSFIPARQEDSIEIDDDEEDSGDEEVADSLVRRR